MTAVASAAAPSADLKLEELGCTIAFNLWWASLSKAKRAVSSGIALSSFRAGWLALRNSSAWEDGFRSGISPETAKGLIAFSTAGYRDVATTLDGFRAIKAGAVPAGTELRALYLEVYAVFVAAMSDEEVALDLLDLLRREVVLDQLLEEGESLD